MKETKLFGKLLPANIDIQGILKKVRKKYDLPEIELGDDPMESYIGHDLDYESIYREIEEGVQKIEWPMPESFKALYLAHKTGKITLSKAAEDASEELQNEIKILMQGYIQILIPTFTRIDAMIEQTTNYAFTYLITGETPEVDESWFGEVQTREMFGETMIIAQASSASDVKAISDQFRAEHRRVFGEQPKITKGRLNAADHLRMKYEGKSISDIADNYILRHPTEFPKDPRSKKYRTAKKKKEQSIKKSMQRLEEVFRSKIGDKK
ncbi:MAG: hypothetical protein DWQ07_08635 [Chloroflexi bacterium]|nr:MAG: hypothetical protein DWQ07_08635 [Chloroflexota bacterium]NOH10516.1 hypothetical protein [Chloroflexota bacterium]